MKILLPLLAALAIAPAANAGVTTPTRGFQGMTLDQAERAELKVNLAVIQALEAASAADGVTTKAENNMINRLEQTLREVAPTRATGAASDGGGRGGRG